MIFLLRRIKAKFPYDDYYLYITFHKKEGRRYANLIPINPNSSLKRTTISYARYLMSVKEGRILDKKEQVDHIDDNKINDEITNLQILTMKENITKQAHKKDKRTIILKYPNCNKIFERRKGQTHLQKGGKYTACSRKCSTTFGTYIQYHLNEKWVAEALKENIVAEYIRHSA